MVATRILLGHGGKSVVLCYKDVEDNLTKPWRTVSCTYPWWTLWCAWPLRCTVEQGRGVVDIAMCITMVGVMVRMRGGWQVSGATGVANKDTNVHACISGCAASRQSVSSVLPEGSALESLVSKWRCEQRHTRACIPQRVRG